MIKPTADELNVSRETYERLEVYVALLEKWTPKINLISKATIPDIWARHISDSVQVYRHAPQVFAHWLDLGSGGGMPGLVVAILAAEASRDSSVSLVESDGRKAAFLRTVLRDTGIPGQVLCERIESLPPQAADVVSARALADLSTLLTYTERHLKPGGIALFSKGVTWQNEVEIACREWSFNFDALKSATEEGSVILKIGEIARV